MKKKFLLPLISLFGGVVAFLLRFLQNRSGFEPDTGLPVPGNPAGLALIVLFLLMAVVILILIRQFSNQIKPEFSAAFSTKQPEFLSVCVGGIFLLALSGLLDLAAGLGLRMVECEFSPGALLILGILTLVSAAALLPATISCYRKISGHQALLLLPPAAMVLRLIFSYRAYSINPVLGSYYIELMALVFLILGFYRLSSFAYQDGKLRPFAACAAMDVVFALAFLADSSSLSALLLQLGGAAVLLGYLLLLIGKDAAD